MCRRCGAPDRRPSAKRRRQLTERLMAIHGNGVIAPCVWCGDLIGVREAVGRLHVGGRYLPITLAERDRLQPGGPYSLWNLVPACRQCNQRRSYDRDYYPDGCYHGGGPAGGQVAS